jgi:hypothetical protein
MKDLQISEPDLFVIASPETFPYVDRKNEPENIFIPDWQISEKSRSTGVNKDKDLVDSIKTEDLPVFSFF